MRVLVVDDEALARGRLRRMLESLPEVTEVQEASGGRDALEKLESYEFDCALLDVRMPGIDGLDVARAAGGLPVVFVTAHDEHAVEAFELAAADYLLKPVRKTRLEQALRKVRRAGFAAAGELRQLLQRALQMDTAPPRVTARRGDSVHVFDPREISRFSASQGYTAFSIRGEEFLMDESLQDLSERLAVFGFLRVHRAELVRLDAVRALHGEAASYSVELRDGQRAPVSRRLVPDLKRRLGIP